MEYLYLGIFLGIILDKFLFPFFELLQERITYSVTVGATRSQMKAQKLVCDFKREYPEVEEIAEQMPAIGFHFPQEESQFDYDEDDDCDCDCDNKLKNKIGF